MADDSPCFTFSTDSPAPLLLAPGRGGGFATLRSAGGTGADGNAAVLIDLTLTSPRLNLAHAPLAGATEGGHRTLPPTHAGSNVRARLLTRMPSTCAHVADAGAARVSAGLAAGCSERRLRLSLPVPPHLFSCGPGAMAFSRVFFLVLELDAVEQVGAGRGGGRATRAGKGRAAWKGSEGGREMRAAIITVCYPMAALAVVSTDPCPPSMSLQACHTAAPSRPVYAGPLDNALAGEGGAAGCSFIVLTATCDPDTCPSDPTGTATTSSSTASSSPTSSAPMPTSTSTALPSPFSAAAVATATSSSTAAARHLAAVSAAATAAGVDRPTAALSDLADGPVADAAAAAAVARGAAAVRSGGALLLLAVAVLSGMFIMRRVKQQSRSRSAATQSKEGEAAASSTTTAKADGVTGTAGASLMPTLSDDMDAVSSCGSAPTSSDAATSTDGSSVTAGDAASSTADSAPLPPKIRSCGSAGMLGLAPPPLPPAPWARRCSLPGDACSYSHSARLPGARSQPLPPAAFSADTSRSSGAGATIGRPPAPPQFGYAPPTHHGSASGALPPPPIMPLQPFSSCVSCSGVGAGPRSSCRRSSDPGVAIAGSIAAQQRRQGRTGAGAAGTSSSGGGALPPPPMLQSGPPSVRLSGSGALPPPPLHHYVLPPLSAPGLVPMGSGSASGSARTRGGVSYSVPGYGGTVYVAGGGVHGRRMSISSGLGVVFEEQGSPRHAYTCAASGSAKVSASSSGVVAAPSASSLAPAGGRRAHYTNSASGAPPVARTATPGTLTPAATSGAKVVVAAARTMSPVHSDACSSSESESEDDEASVLPASLGSADRHWHTAPLLPLPRRLDNNCRDSPFADVAGAAFSGFPVLSSPGSANSSSVVSGDASHDGDNDPATCVASARRSLLCRSKSTRR